MENETIRVMLTAIVCTLTFSAASTAQFARTRSPYFRVASRIFQILTDPGTSNIFCKKRTSPPRGHPALFPVSHIRTN